MSDYRSSRFDQEPRERAPTVAESIELGVRRIATSIVIAGGLIAIGVYAGGDDGDEAPRYQMTAAEGRIYRVNTENGTVISCQGERCGIVLRRGQRLEEELREQAEEAEQARHPRPAEAPENAAAALPAPSPAPTGPAAPHPAPR